MSYQILLLLCLHMLTLATFSVRSDHSSEKFEQDCATKALSCVGFGLADCMKSITCEYFFGFQPEANTGRVAFHMLSHYSASTDFYFAAGFSDGPVMGNDAVVACIHYGNSTFVSLSKNIGKSNVPALRHETTALEVKEADHENGRIYCSFTLPVKFTVRQSSYNLTSPYTLLFAHGPSKGPGKLSYHGTLRHDATTRSFLMTTSAFESTSFLHKTPPVKDWAIIVHVTLVVYAYLCLMPTGILVARYLKECHVDVFEDPQPLGQRIWFTIHMCLELGSILLILVGHVVLILANSVVLRSSVLTVRMHYIAGIMGYSLLTFNAIVGGLRFGLSESLTHTGKIVFGFIHWLVGVLSYSFGIIQLFVTPYFIPSDIASCILPSVVTLTSVGLFLVAYLLLTMIQQWQDYRDEAKMTNKVKPLVLPSRRGSVYPDQVIEVKPILKKKQLPSPEDQQQVEDSGTQINEVPGENPPAPPPPSPAPPHPHHETKFPLMFFHPFKSKSAHVEDAAHSSPSAANPKPKERNRKLRWKTRMSHVAVRGSASKASHAQHTHEIRFSDLTVDTLQIDNEFFLLEPPVQHDYFRLVFALDDEESDDEYEWDKWRSLRQFPMKTLVRENALTSVYEIIVGGHFILSAAIAGYLCFHLFPSSQFRGNCARPNEMDTRGVWFI